MEGQVITLITSVLSIIISVFTVLGFLSKYSDSLFRKAARKAFETVKSDELNPNSELYGTMKKVQELSKMCDIVKSQSKNHEENLGEITRMLKSVTEELQESKRDRFKADLRSRLEFTITKKGRVDVSYWEHIVEDYQVYTDVLKMNSYMGSLYRIAEKLYIKVNVKKDFTE
jgi:sugar/nucleoside kinase (ribokinase family)